ESLSLNVHSARDAELHSVEGWAVSMGNPNFVIAVQEPLLGGREGAPLSAETLVRGLGPVIENHVHFPERTNVEFVRVVGYDVLEMRVWERGTGETMACGSGACAAVAAALHAQWLKLPECAPVQVILAGGKLEITLDRDRRTITKKG